MKSLSEDELKNLLTEARKHSERNYLAILVSYWHGLRASEVRTLTTRSVRDARLTVTRLKGSKRTTHALVSHCDAVLDESKALPAYIATLAPGARLFDFSRIRFYQIVQEYGRGAGIPSDKCHPHALKHSIAMHRINRAGVQNLQVYLGHVSLNSTAKYLEITEEAAQSAVMRD
jgi:integrase/recombinase XerD